MKIPQWFNNDLDKLVEKDLIKQIGKDHFVINSESKELRDYLEAMQKNTIANLISKKLE